jgi:hypothetical protein
VAARDPESALLAAIEGLYAVFSRYPLRPWIDSCDHCSHDDRPLRARPLRDLTAEDLSDYAHSAISTWGGADDFRHFLPRLAEIAVDSPDDHLHEVASKLSYARWRDWPEDERGAVDRWFRALWEASLARPIEQPAMMSLDGHSEVLRATARVYESVDPFLEAWTSSPREVAARRLAAFVTDHHAQVMKRASRAFNSWGAPAETSRRLLSWLAGPEVSGRLDAALLAAADDEVREEFAVALNLLPGIRRRLGSYR